VTVRPTTTTFWCERAWLSRAAGHHDGVAIVVEAGAITRVTTGVATPPNGAVVLRGLTVPGAANSHSHAFHRALRARTHASGGTFWTWRDRMYSVAAVLDPDRYERLARGVFAEMLLAGFTAVGEFHYLHHQGGGVPYGDANEMGWRLVRAAAEVGIRITLLDTCYLSGGIGAPPTGVQQRFTDRTVEEWVERVGVLADAVDGRVLVGAAAHSVRAVDPLAIASVATWAGERGTVLHAHVSEQVRENDDCLAAHGCTPVELFDRNGALEARFCAVHATHVGQRDIERLASAGAACCICPTTERDLADGIGPTAALRRVGLCIGSDSHAVIDPFEEARAIELDQRLATGRRGTHSPVDLMHAATAAGYRALGWEGGTIAVGQLADLVTIGLDSPRLAGHDRRDPASAVVFAATAADVREVVVGGDHVVHGGHHSSVDVPRDLAGAIDDVWSLL
jgi:formiminoglutamate deiminase